MDNILNGLNAAQKSAVTSTASVLQILAPPGSGKTKTLTSRVAYLLSQQYYKPWNILCLTFTIKSSRELKERIAKIIGNGLESKLVLGTFHSVCRRYLVSYGYLIGLRKGFGIADSSDSQAIIDRIVKRLKINIDPKAARSRISSSKARSISYAELALDSSRGKKVDQQEFVKLFEAYETQLAASNLLDYDDLLLRCVDLLRDHPNCVSNVEVVLIDEFQDTNLVQFDLMRLFAAKCRRITTVGDPDQSIYGWRSAEIKNLKRMQTQYPETLVIHLEDNYRSSGAILLAALEVIEQDLSRPSKPLSPTHCPGTTPVLRRLPTAAIEAAWVVSEIQRSSAMTGNLLRYSDFAILLRSASLSRHIESVMGKAGIPYRMVGGLRFFDRSEIKILLDYLRAICQPDNSTAFARIINVPSRRIGEGTIKSLLEEAETRGLTLWNLVRDGIQGHVIHNTKISKAAEQGFGALINIIMTARMKMLDPTNPHLPDKILEYVIKRLDFQAYLEKTYPNDHEVRWANAQELLAQASDCFIHNDDEPEEDGEDSSLPHFDGVKQDIPHAAEEALSTFLANVALSTELQRDDAADGGDAIEARITISTIHASKGLEWPVVFIPSVYEGFIPHSRAEDTDEERRLLYVAITRAQALLYMSCPTKNSMHEETTLSSFLSPKKVSAYLVKKGPLFTMNTIQDIARILRRDFPTEQSIAESAKATENREDDLWPTNGEEDPKAVEAKWEDFERGNASKTASDRAKRRRIALHEEKCLSARFLHSRAVIQNGQDYPTDSNITMYNKDTFTITPYISGFVSATIQLQNTKQEELSAQSTRVKPSKVDQKHAEKQGRQRASKSAQGRGSLISFWSQNKETSSVIKSSASTATVALGTGTSCDNSKKGIEAPAAFIVDDQPGIDNLTRTTPMVGMIGRQHRKPMTAIPQALARHKLRPIANTSRPQLSHIEFAHEPKQYVFLSSSPPPLETLLVEAEQSFINTSVGRKPDRDGLHKLDKEERSSDIRPATSYHSTSVEQVNTAHNGPRRTLGVRRSMTGWSARGGYTFAPPSISSPGA